MPLFLFVVNRVTALRASHSSAYLIAALRRRGVRVAVTDLAHLDWNPARETVARALELPAWARQPFAVCQALQEGARVAAEAAAHTAANVTAISGESPARLSTLSNLSTLSTLASIAPGLGERPPVGWQAVPLAAVTAVWMRCNPHTRRRGGPAAVAWAQILESRGRLCLNATAGLWKTADKGHLFDLPAEFRPRSLLSRNRADLLACIRSLGRTVVLKPAHGFGGERVFIIERGRFDNLNAILDMLLEQGPVLVQEYLQAAADGDRRVLLWNGRPLEWDGHASLYRRMRAPGDLRNNLHVGGLRARCRLNRNDQAAIEGIGDFIRRNGIWLAGVDIIGGRVLEINAWAPGGIHNINELYGVAADDLLAERSLELVSAHGARDPVRGAG